jgi:hypothetical protein
MARLSNETMRSPSYISRLLDEADDSFGRAQVAAFDILADANTSASPDDFQSLTIRAEALRDKAAGLSRIFAALQGQLARVADLQAQLASKGEAKTTGKKMAAAAE